MTLPRRRFLQLAAGSAAFPGFRGSQGRKRPNRFLNSSCHFRQAARPTQSPVGLTTNIAAHNIVTCKDN